MRLVITSLAVFNTCKFIKYITKQLKKIVMLLNWSKGEISRWWSIIGNFLLYSMVAISMSDGWLYIYLQEHSKTIGKFFLSFTAHATVCDNSKNVSNTCCSFTDMVMKAVKK